jgi:hypothetical protein
MSAAQSPDTFSIDEMPWPFFFSLFLQQPQVSDLNLVPNIFIQIGRLIDREGIEAFEENYCPLARACTYRNEKLVQLLLAKGANPNKTIFEWKITPLMAVLSCSSGYGPAESEPRIIGMLLAAGADVSLQAESEATALDFARIRIRTRGSSLALRESIALLEEAPRQRSRWEESPLKRAWVEAVVFASRKATRSPSGRVSPPAPLYSSP